MISLSFIFSTFTFVSYHLSTFSSLFLLSLLCSILTVFFSFHYFFLFLHTHTHTYTKAWGFLLSWSFKSSKLVPGLNCSCLISDPLFHPIKIAALFSFQSCHHHLTFFCQVLFYNPIFIFTENLITMYSQKCSGQFYVIFNKFSFEFVTFIFCLNKHAHLICSTYFILIDAKNILPFVWYIQFHEEISNI